jgi:formylglycine-generating enzyme required for sulfatase activity
LDTITVKGISVVRIKFKNKTLVVSQKLITNLQFIKFLNTIGTLNEVDGTYRWVNTNHINTKIVQSNKSFYQEQNGEHYKYPPILSNKTYSIVKGFEKHPVVCVNWLGAKEFANFLGGRLLTKTEWEYLASGGNLELDYPWGNDFPTKEYANFGELFSGTTKVGLFPCNSFGLFDMAGNVREWCDDWYTKHEKLIKGGGWNKPGFHLKIKKDLGKWFRLGGASIGFRVVFDN